MRARESDAPLKQSETASREFNQKRVLARRIFRGEMPLFAAFDSRVTRSSGYANVQRVTARRNFPAVRKQCYMRRLCSEDELETIPGILGASISSPAFEHENIVFGALLRTFALT